MHRLLLPLALAAGLALAATADAGRVPSSRVQIVPDPGARTDVYVPYLSNGRSPFGVANGVAPILMAKPGLGAKNDNQVKPVYNLIYYGSKKSPNSSFTGAIPREPNKLRPNR